MRVAVYEKRWIQVRKAARERIDKARRLNLCVACMQPIVDGERVVRGCHNRCYFATYRQIKAGKYTDAERVRDGKLLESAEPGRKPSNPVSLEAE